MSLLRKLLLYVDTLRYLKGIQIRYQVIHRIRRVLFSLTYYKKFTGRTFYPLRYKYEPCIVSKQLYRGNNSFQFLNKTKDFANGIDWNDNVFGKLWNYNLQYFDYLCDEAITDADKIKLVDDFSAAIISGVIKPEPFPVSLRLVNWIIFYSCTKHRGELFTKALLLQIGFLEKNREFHLLANHLLENNITLAICGFALNDEVFTRRYILDVLKQLDEQVLNDGGHYEGSAMYHSLLLAKILLLTDIMEEHSYDNHLLRSLRTKAELMLGWLAAFCNGNNSYSFFNDAAPGIAVEPGQLFERAKLMGLEWQTAHLHESGYRVLSNAPFELIIDVAEIMPSYQPGHAHSDLFHFAMYYNTTPVFVEAGTSTYENNTRREYERSTTAHNTVVVNGTNQSQVWNSFRVAKRAKPHILKDQINNIKASHNGYETKYGVIHTRSFSTERQGIVEVYDELSGTANKTASGIAFFHLHPSISVESITDQTIHLSNNIQIIFEQANTIETATYQKSDGFNRLVDAQKIMVSFTQKLKTQISIL